MLIAPQTFAVPADHFQFEGSLLAAEPYGTGHINDTYLLVFRGAAGPTRYLLQRINHNVFKSPPIVMQNIERVTAHVARKLAGRPGAHRQIAAIIPTRDGGNCYCDPAGNYWRAQTFIEHTYSRDTAGTPAEAFHAARAFARFQLLLADLPAPRLHETIPDFHNTPRRFADLQRAIKDDALGRAAQAAPEIDIALRYESLVASLLEAGLPQRVTHNDTKLNNVLFDAASNEAICVIDLDTVMPGLAPFDFGDMVRSMTSPAPEDEPDPANVTMRPDFFEALARGFLSHAAQFLTREEKDCLVLAGKVITLENGFRFLADFLQGDTYYRTAHPDQNLHRARAQFALADSITRHESEMRRLIDEI